MYKTVKNFLLLIPVLIAFGCSSGTSAPPAGATVSSNTAVFDPGAGNVPLPNILATATAADPLTGRVANKPMTPPEALAYVNLHEVGGTNAVAGLNAPIYIRFQKPVVPATVTPATVKVFQLGVDSNGLTETGPLGFVDISAMFDFSYSAGGTDLHLFPKFPLQPGVRYLYVVTSGVKDAATGGSLSGSFYFEALKATTPLLGAFAGLEAIRDNVYADAGKTVVKLSGYAKVMDDLIAASGTTTITSRAQIAVLGRFITTAAGYVQTDAASAASRIPVESALRAFAAGAALGGLTGKTWTNAVNGATTIPAAAFWTGAGLPGAPPSTLATVVTGSINSAQLSIDPVVAKANASSIDLSAVSGAYNFQGAGVVQPYRDTAGALTGYYHTSATIPFVYLVPSSPNGKTIIFQHSITRQKEDVLALAGTLTGAGYAVVAIDLPLHNALAIPTHTTGDSWGEDFMALGAPLATRSNIQQAAFNLNRMELTLKTGGFAAAGIAPAPPTEIKFVGFSLGSVVGAYYLAGNTTLATSGAPYSQSSLNSDMKGFLSVPGARLAYLMQNSPSFGPSINAGLAAKGVIKDSPTYHQFFQVTQTIIDPADPASVTTPLAAGLPSRLSGRLAIQEATSTTFAADGITPTNGDLTITNPYTRYLGNALGGREILGSAGTAVAPGFRQLGYRGGALPRIPSSFMYTQTAGAPAPKADFAAQSGIGAATPSEGYFQFDQTGVNHGFLIDPTASLANTQFAQSQMVQYLLYGGIVDPTPTGAAKVVAGPEIPAMNFDFHLPPVLKIFGY
jgi:hypothetical protein